MPVPDHFHPSTAVLLHLLEMRGGCTCFVSPPCAACSQPITDAEFDELLDAFPDELAPATAPVDYGAATKALCR